MMDFKERLIEEDKQLTEKIIKLAVFIDSQKFNDLAIQRILLKVQHSAMITYSICLVERIKML